MTKLPLISFLLRKWTIPCLGICFCQKWNLILFITRHTLVLFRFFLFLRRCQIGKKIAVNNWRSRIRHTKQGV